MVNTGGTGCRPPEVICGEDPERDNEREWLRRAPERRRMLYLMRELNRLQSRT
jgi:hypothetical protein